MSVPMKPSDPAYWMLGAPDIHSQPVVYKADCYICTDPEFMLMGMPLCRKCCICEHNKVNPSYELPINPKAPQNIEPGYGHIPADDAACDYCGHECDPTDPECNYYEEAGSSTTDPL